jgi:hypothetical protein
VKLSWLGNWHISLSGHKETKHEQDPKKKGKPEKELFGTEFNAAKAKKLSVEWAVPWCLGGREK